MAFKVPVFEHAMAAAKAHALSQWPKESCGLIVNGGYVPCENKATNPEEDFVIGDDMVLLNNGGIDAVVHSHPKGNRYPSARDMQGQMDMGCPWAIIPCNENETMPEVWWGDFMLEQSLLKREFIHGVSDCYALIRAYYWQERKIILPEFPRDIEWWKAGGDFYQHANFSKAGFVRIEQEEAAIGDVFIGQVRSDVPNHGGILLDHGEGLHHLDGRLSRREPIGPWQRYITYWLRYKG